MTGSPILAGWPLLPLQVAAETPLLRDPRPSPGSGQPVLCTKPPAALILKSLLVLMFMCYVSHRAVGTRGTGTRLSHRPLRSPVVSTSGRVQEVSAVPAQDDRVEK